MKNLVVKFDRNKNICAFLLGQIVMRKNRKNAKASGKRLIILTLCKVVLSPSEIDCDDLE